MRTVVYLRAHFKKLGTATVNPQTNSVSESPAQSFRLMAQWLLQAHVQEKAIDHKRLARSKVSSSASCTGSHKQWPYRSPPNDEDSFGIWQ